MSERISKTTYAMSRRRRNTILLLCVPVLVTLICLDHSTVKHKHRTPHKPAEKAQAYDFAKYHEKNFTVVKVVDGDTLDIDIADGEYDRTRIRLWGIDTPETKSDKYGVMYFGPQAAEFTRQVTLGKAVTVYLDEANRTRGKYGRLLAYVKLPDGRFLNEVLLMEGFAYADSRFRHSFYNKYKQLEGVARSGRKGLWQKVTPEQMPQWRRKNSF